MTDVPNILELSMSELRGSSAQPPVLIGLVPELELLRSVMEINDWHDYETTWAHTWAVVENVRSLCCNIHLQPLVGELSHKNINGSSLLELFTWANILHDIGKPATQNHFYNSTGIRQSLFPGHEAKGAEMTKVILERLGFGPEAIAWIVYIVRWHGDMHAFFGKPEEEFYAKRDAWKQTHPHHWRELFLHSWADTMDGYHAVTDPTMYALRMKRYWFELIEE